MKKRIFLFAALFFVFSVSAETQRFFVESTIAIDGKKVASPGLMVEEEQDATVKLDGVFSLDVKATEAENAILLETQFTQGERSASHSILLVPGREAKISTGPASLTFTVRRVPGDA